MPKCQQDKKVLTHRSMSPQALGRLSLTGLELEAEAAASKHSSDLESRSWGGSGQRQGLKMRCSLGQGPGAAGAAGKKA